MLRQIVFALKHRFPLQAVFGLAALSVPLNAPSALAGDGWYISGSAGAYFRAPNNGITTNLSNGLGVTVLGTNTETYSPGAIFNLGMGYRIRNNLRVEAEFGFTKYYLKTISPYTSDRANFPYLTGSQFGSPTGGDRERYSETVNIFYDLPVEGHYIPYIGTGFGAAEDRGSPAVFVIPGSVPTTHFRSNGVATGTHPSALGEAGLTIQLSDHWAIVPSYRYQYIFRGGNAVSEAASIAKVGLRRSF